jgi:uncharacterized protein (TIGR02001 family)
MQRGTRMETGVRAIRGRAALLGLASLMAAGSAQAQYEISGNIGVVSDYVLRGITTPGTESDGLALQGGFDVEDTSGFYGGWWASSLGYGTENLATTVENNFYVGYAGAFDEFFFDLGALYYWYMDDSDSSGFEPYAAIGWGPVALEAAYLATDTSWGNRGDIYWNVGVDLDLGLGFELSVVGGYYTYKDSGRYIDATARSSAFRHSDVTLAHQIGSTPATMFATYTLGGKDRDGISQRDKIVLGLSYNFGVR